MKGRRHKHCISLPFPCLQALLSDPFRWSMLKHTKLWWIYVGSKTLFNWFGNIWCWYMEKCWYLHCPSQAKRHFQTNMEILFWRIVWKKCLVEVVFPASAALRVPSFGPSPSCDPNRGQYPTLPQVSPCWWSESSQDEDIKSVCS